MHRDFPCQLCLVRGLMCDQKLLGPKTESRKGISVAPSDSMVPSPVPSTDVGLFTDSEIQALQSYFHYNPCIACFKIKELLVEMTEFDKRIAWLSFGRNSTCFRNAVLPLAIIASKLRIFGFCTFDQEMLSKYQSRSCSDLRLAITKGDNFEIFCSSLFLINSSLTLGEGREPIISTSVLIHFSGLWAAMKLLYFDSSVTTPQWMIYEWHFMRNLNQVKYKIGDNFRSRLSSYSVQKGPHISRIGETITSILLQFLNWPIPSLSEVDDLYPRIRYCRLEMAFFFRILTPDRIISRPLEFDETLDILRSLTCVDMQIAFGIDQFLHDLSGIDFFPPLPLGCTLEFRFSRRVCEHLFYKILDLSVSSDDFTMEMEIMKACYQLTAAVDASSTAIRLHEKEFQEDILFFVGLFLTRSRHPTGTN